MMPDMDGQLPFKIAGQSCDSAFPVILLTAKVQASDRRRYADMGMTAVIAKPFALELAGQVAEADWSWEKKEPWEWVDAYHPTDRHACHGHFLLTVYCPKVCES